MSHSLEQTIRDAYAAFGRGDVDGYLRACTDNFTFNVPGRGGISGAWVGRQGLYNLASKAMSTTGGTFQEDVEDVLANDQHAIVHGIASNAMAFRRSTVQRTSMKSAMEN